MLPRPILPRNYLEEFAEMRHEPSLRLGGCYKGRGVEPYGWGAVLPSQAFTQIEQSDRFHHFGKPCHWCNFIMEAFGIRQNWIFWVLFLVSSAQALSVSGNGVQYLGIQNKTSG